MEKARGEKKLKRKERAGIYQRGENEVIFATM